MNARQTIDEMAHMILGRRKKPTVTDIKVGVDVYSTLPALKAFAVAVLSNGQFKHFEVTEPTDADDTAMVHAARAVSGGDSFYATFPMTQLEVRLREKNWAKLQSMREEVVRQAKAWVYDNEREIKYGKLKRPQSIKLDYDAAPLVKGFRFIRFAKGSRKGMDSVLALTQSAAPGESVLKVEGSDMTHTGLRYVYYVLLTPEERQELERRRIQVERERIGGILGQ